MLDEFLKNELSFNREAGTYLFYGDDLEKNYNIALEFSAELFSKNVENEIEKNKIIDLDFIVESIFNLLEINIKKLSFVGSSISFSIAFALSFLIS